MHRRWGHQARPEPLALDIIIIIGLADVAAEPGKLHEEICRAKAAAARAKQECDSLHGRLAANNQKRGELEDSVQQLLVGSEPSQRGSDSFTPGFSFASICLRAVAVYEGLDWDCSAGREEVFEDCGQGAGGQDGRSGAGEGRAGGRVQGG